jgi:hypothetical protein
MYIIPSLWFCAIKHSAPITIHFFAPFIMKKTKEPLLFTTKGSFLQELFFKQIKGCQLCLSSFLLIRIMEETSITTPRAKQSPPTKVFKRFAKKPIIPLPTAQQIILRLFFIKTPLL